MENNKYKGMVSKCYKGEKINELISLDKQIKELQDKRRTLSREIKKDTIGFNSSEFPICGFLYYDTWETKLVKKIVIAFLVLHIGKKQVKKYRMLDLLF